MFSTYPLVLCTLTPLHVGSGRAGGKIDIAIQRDAFGLPVIYSTSIKGPLKTLLTLSSQYTQCVEVLFGSDIKFKKGEVEVAPAKTVFTDAYLLAFPVSCEEREFIYVTSPYMLKRAIDTLSLCNHSATANLKEIYSKCTEKLKSDVRAVPLKAGKIVERTSLLYVQNEAIKIEIEHALNLDFPRELVEKLQYPASTIPERLIVVSDEIARELVNEYLIKHTRISIEYRTKRVRKGALWSEEHVPTGTIFIGAMLVRNGAEGKCSGEDTCLESLINMLRAGIIVALGGKETVGRGYTRIVML